MTIIRFKQKTMTIRIRIRKFRTYFSHLKQSCVLNWPGDINFSIWLVGFFVMLGLTAKDLFPLVDDYKNNNTATQMTIKSEPQAPNFTICLPYWSTYLFTTLRQLKAQAPEYLNGTKSMKGKCGRCYDMEVAGFDFWIHMNATELNSTKTVIRYLVKKFYEKRLHKITLDEENFHWMQPLVDAVWYYFSWIYEYDLYVLTSPEYAGLRDTDWKSHEALDWLTREAADELYEYMLNSIAQCVFGHCTSRNTSDTIKNEILPDFRIKELVTIVGDEFCFPAPTYFGGKDYVCSYNRAYNRSLGLPFPWLWDRYPTSDFIVYSTPAVLYSSVKNKDALYSTDGDIKKTKNESEHVFLTYYINQRLIAKKPHGTPCSEENDVEICTAKNLLLAAIEECHCVPFTYRNFLEENTTSPNNNNFSTDHVDFPYCNSTHYNFCGRNIRQNHFDAIKEKCGNKCKYTFYNWDAKPSIRYNEFNATWPQFVVSFAASKAPFMEFHFEDKNSPAEFIGAVGGIVNLYLGVSGLSLFALLILLIDQTKNWYKHHRQIQQTKREQRKTNFDIWQFFRIVGVFHMLGSIGSDDPKAKEDNFVKTTEIGELKEKLVTLERTTDEIRDQMRRMEKLLARICAPLCDSDEITRL